MKAAFASTSHRLIMTVVLTLLMASSCVIDPHSDDDIRNHNNAASEDFTFSLGVINQTRLEVDAINGTVDVVAVANATSIEIWGERRVESDSKRDAERHLDDLSVEIVNTADFVEVRTEQPSHTHGRNYLVFYQIRVPEDFFVEVDQTNGAVYVARMIDGARVDVTNGEVVMEDIEGHVEADVTNGLLTARRLYGSMDGRVTNGNITVRMQLAHNAECSLETTNGQIDLEVPRQTSAVFSARWTNGNVFLNNLSLQNRQQGTHSLDGRLGNGDGSISLRTTNGTIAVSGYQTDG